ncbi:MAG TPA: hypothetical protein DDZ80_08770 [Cyanobacteria bacterium UBA8803]|nr:hypothetical protein [Cyanobacteria bacterium UBA8803]
MTPNQLPKKAALSSVNLRKFFNYQAKKDRLKVNPNGVNSKSLTSTPSDSTVDAQIEAICYFCG